MFPFVWVFSVAWLAKIWKYWASPRSTLSTSGTSFLKLPPLDSCEAAGALACVSSGDSIVVDTVVDSACGCDSLLFVAGCFSEASVCSWLSASTASALVASVDWLSGRTTATSVVLIMSSFTCPFFSSVWRNADLIVKVLRAFVWNVSVIWLKELLVVSSISCCLCGSYVNGVPLLWIDSGRTVCSPLLKLNASWLAADCWFFSTSIVQVIFPVVGSGNEVTCAVPFSFWNRIILVFPSVSAWAVMTGNNGIT